MLLLIALTGMIFGLLLIAIAFYMIKKRQEQKKLSEEITNLRFPRAVGKRLK